VEAAVGSEPEEPGLTDEPRPRGEHAATPAGSGGEQAPLRAVPSPMASLPAGAAFGILVHAVLERADFTASDLGAELTRVVHELSGRYRPPELDETELAGGLRAALETPLGPPLGELRLASVDRRDRLDELGFELPLADGNLTVRAIAGMLRQWVPDDDPLSSYADRLEDPVLSAALRGYLTGSIDLALRVAVDGADRFLVVDYKTNWLGPPGEPLVAWHYRQEALAAAMQEAHYPLQALLYLVALHRYLRWRLPGYDPHRNLGGVLYLFLRGMCGTAAGSCGVFSWAPPTGLVTGLSDLFDGMGARL
jgi:exodeoxyribonuclease V beta subunit